MRTHYNAIAMAVVAGAVLVSPVALAHATLQRSLPPAGAIIDVAPQEIVLSFNEKVEQAFSRITLADGAGTTVATGPARVDEANPAVLRLAVPLLAAGSYTVSWAVAGHDGHRRAGDFRFTVK